MPERDSYTPTASVADLVSKYYTMYSNQRRPFERRWYENNMFDDGNHFRYVSRTTGKIVQSNEVSADLPIRSIPKASRQIRGVANLLSGLEPTPAIYPESVNTASIPDKQQQILAVEQAKKVAKQVGHWLEEEFKDQEITEKLIQMIILTAKNSISFLQIWPDAIDEKINTTVYDAFDIYLAGNLTSIYDSPCIIKATPEFISKIQANELFDPVATAMLSPDNKYASSEVKQAYLASKYNSGQENEGSTTIILKEAFIKEYLNKNNYAECKILSQRTGAMENKKMGDVMIRHVFEAGGQKLLDEYVDLPEYPFVDFRMEPGLIYQTPLIERFIPANKSLDIAVSRVERWLNTMVVGVWLTRDGEDLQVTNIPGGQKVTYKTTPPTQMPIAPLPQTVFNFIGLQEKLIEEQGASTAALGQLPEGVKSGVAIESVKETEYANLKIATRMFKQTTKHIAEKFLDIADNYFLNPQTVYYLEQGEPQYFDIIGGRGVKYRKDNNIPMREGLVPVKGDYYVDIEIESGLGFTMQGKKDSMQQILNFMTNMAKENLIPQEAVKVVAQRALETFQYGSTQEFMDAMEENTTPMNPQQVQDMKVALLEVLKDTGMVGQEGEQKMVDSTKLGVVEAMKDTGMLNKQKETQQPKEPSQSISFKDLPPSGKAQLAAKAGLNISPQEIQAEGAKEFDTTQTQ